MVCDLDRIIVHTNFTGTVSTTHAIPLESLGDSRSIAILRAVFHNPETLHPARTSIAVTQDAARQFAEIADAMRKPERGLDPADVAHFLDRIVFCLFAEDTRLLPDMVFNRIVKNSTGDPARFGKMLGQLFDTMATGGDFGLESIRHFNGNLFGNDNGFGSFLPMVGPWQLHGIEINSYAHDLAQMTVWIGWLQWIRANGFGFPADPILRPCPKTSA